MGSMKRLADRLSGKPDFCDARQPQGGSGPTAPLIKMLELRVLPSALPL
jgi:hypothetical protein